jgi:hypothetical protein
VSTATGLCRILPRWDQAVAGSIVLVIATFVLGFAAGAFLIAVERRARIAKIKQDFQEHLESIVNDKIIENSTLATQDMSAPETDTGDRADRNPSQAA